MTECFLHLSYARLKSPSAFASQSPKEQTVETDQAHLQPETSNCAASVKEAFTARAAYATKHTVTHVY